ncbi:papain fold toxin 1 (glutamine deamidase) of polymorphic toxin system [Saccharothrix carnea]|uniref:Papain fold toxin 1 (Glutamine deamidase) of polymorphic toxin system n=1 Tax=Saccharothrix carnea TaxID=1280637 RepID=A0A2P8I830_SACCR|nr:YrhB domain-containing protein [Saccharothrix carnea]PSL54621.1 papain fold toxin 1 (glutamine deamidase) of polymorphic toxin system [Saccharothrix carnea]
MTQARDTADQWLDRVYGGTVKSSRHPLLETSRVAVFGCRFRESRDPMLAAAIAVPTTGEAPYPLPNDRPFDDLGLNDDAADWRAPVEADWTRRVNARNCVIALDAAVDHAPASALPWRPSDEQPGWWDRLRAGHFPQAEVAACATWPEVVEAVRAGGPDTRGVVWVRRELAGVEVTGHLLYAHNNDGEVAVLDAMRGTLAHLETAALGSLLLARFHRPRPDVSELDYAAAVRAAERHLAGAYGDEVVLVDPSPEDELSSGWLFACTTRAFQSSGDLRDQMLDAALVVPKNPGRTPFALPNADPWGWLSRWDAGEADLPAPPAPGPAAWLAPTLARLGDVTEATSHTRWSDVLADFTTRPVGTAAVIWIRRHDRRGRESVGHLVNARRVEGGLELADGTTTTPFTPSDEGTSALHVVYYR